MPATDKAQTILDRLGSTPLRLMEIRALAKEYGKNQATADELWRQGTLRARLLALLMLDMKVVDTRAIDSMRFCCT